MKSFSSASRRAFSLVELLVVIGVISILLSLLMPVLRMARQHADQIKCAAQLRMAFSMYTNDNHGWLPTWSGWHVYPAGSSPEDTPGLGWEEKLMPWYVPPDSPVYSCPSFIGTAAGDPFNNYFIAAAWAGAHGQHSIKLTDVKMNGRFVLSGDVSQAGLYPYPYGVGGMASNDDDRDDFGVDCLAFTGEDNNGFSMHLGGNNVLFDDLHVALFDHFDAGAMTFHPLRMSSWYDVAGP